MTRLTPVSRSFRHCLDTDPFVIDPSILAVDRKRSDLLGTDMMAIYRAQIMSLWENVEGAQRFIPQAQHKQIIRECVDFYEMNPKTMQARQAVHLFLMNDCLLVARRRSNGQLVAEYCWSVEDLTIMDMKDTEGRWIEDRDVY